MRLNAFTELWLERIHCERMVVRVSSFKVGSCYCQVRVDLRDDVRSCSYFTWIEAILKPRLLFVAACEFLWRVVWYLKYVSATELRMYGRISTWDRGSRALFKGLHMVDKHVDVVSPLSR